MECNQSLMEIPPPDIHLKYNYSVNPPKADLSDQTTWKEKRAPVEWRQRKREAFMLCRLIPALNEAATFHKRRVCNASTVNLSESWNVYDDPADY